MGAADLPPAGVIHGLTPGVEHAPHNIAIDKIRPHAFIRVSRAEASDPG
jgi:hypothetical protein